jgi:SET domain-containing protein
MFEINSRWTIDGSKRWNVARYVNHSCRPNAEALERRRRIVYVARRRIKPEEEITVDYGKDYFEAFIGKKHCRCMACRSKASMRRSRRKRSTRKRLKRKR